MSESKVPSLDIVVIGRNEGDLLEIALRSARQAADKYHSETGHAFRIIYVDGQSTDNSVERARSLGIEVFVIEGQPSAAVGRQVGYQRGDGDYVFFLDGDMELNVGWLLHGIRYLENNSDCAGVAGIVDWLYIKGEKATKINNYFGIIRDGQTVTNSIGGTGLYSRRDLEKVGGWNTDLPVEEEFDLYLRMLAQDRQIVNLNSPMTLHRDVKSGNLKSYLRRSIFNRNIFYPGYVARRAPKHPRVIRALVQRYWPYFAHMILMLCLLGSLVKWNVERTMHFLMFMFVVGGLLAIVHLIHKRWNWKRSLMSIVTMNMYSVAFLLGVLGYNPSRNTRP